MKSPDALQGTHLKGWLGACEKFFFTPSDPAVLGLVRICAGLVVVYTLYVYTYRLNAWVGPKGWYALTTRMNVVEHRAIPNYSMTGWDQHTMIEPKNKLELDFKNAFSSKFNALPRAPYPKTEAEAAYIIDFGERYKFDYRNNGIAAPQTPDEKKYLEDFAKKWKQAPFKYPETTEEAKAIDAYIATHHVDPHSLYVQGSPVFSVWFDITDPNQMMAIHLGLIVAGLLFTVGCCTRLTAAISWFGYLCYVHRNPIMVFGVDTMMIILLTYLTIGPSGAAYSVDRWLKKWRSGEAATERKPLATATFALRLIQIHACIIYFVAGISKLQGAAWWNGTAPWGTLANFEFAPMNNPVYMALIRAIASTQWVQETVMTLGCYFTLSFELAYPFLVWHQRTRWVILFSALIFHGLIGVFMGLATFAITMLVLNFAFLSSAEIHWAIDRWIGEGPSTSAGSATKKAGVIEAA